jgi:hypothetical protein
MGGNLSICKVFLGHGGKSINLQSFSWTWGEIYQFAKFFLDMGGNLSICKVFLGHGGKSILRTRQNFITRKMIENRELISFHWGVIFGTCV